MRTLTSKLLAAAKLSAVLALFLLLQPQEARADYLFFTDQSTYNAALAQAGITQQPVRYNEPGTIQTGTFVSGYVPGTTLNGPGDVTVFFSALSSLTTTASGIQGTSGPFTSLSISAFAGLTRGDFQSLSGFIELAQVQVGGPSAVPEPATMLLPGTGLAGVFSLARRRRRGREGAAG